MQVLTESDKEHLVKNIAGHLKDAQEFIQERAVRNFASADPEYGKRIQKLLDQYKIEVNWNEES